MLKDIATSMENSGKTTSQKTRPSSHQVVVQLSPSFNITWFSISAYTNKKEDNTLKLQM